eukprot:COSAG02_NODE_40934_length_400_cov_0.358804_1_plen_73_part_01
MHSCFETHLLTHYQLVLQLSSYNQAISAISPKFHISLTYTAVLSPLLRFAVGQAYLIPGMTELTEMTDRRTVV